MGLCLCRESGSEDENDIQINVVEPTTVVAPDKTSSALNSQHSVTGRRLTVPNYLSAPKAI